MFGLSKKQKIAFWLILLVGFGLRLWLMLTQHDKLITVYDDKMYLQSAKRLLESGIFTFGSYINTPTVFIPPLFPLYLTGVFAVFGTGDAGMYAAQSGLVLMGTAVLALLVRLGAQIKRPGAGLVAAAVMAFYPPTVLLSTLYLTEMMFTMLTLLFFIWLIKGIESHRRGDFIIAGLFLGLATLTRPTFALFPAVVGLYLWGRKDYRFKKAFLVGVTLVVTLLVVLSPWMMRNYADFHTFIPLTKASGNPFLTGTYINNDVWAQGHDEQFPDYPKGWKKVPGDLIATDDVLMNLGKQHLQEQFEKQPVAMIKWYTYGKFKNYWAYPFDWADRLLDWKIGLTITHRILLLLSFFGLLYALWRRVPYTWLFLLWLGYFTALHMVYVTSGRYATPLLPYVFLYFGILVTEPLKRKA